MFHVPCGFATLCLALTSCMLYISTDHYKWTYTCNLTAKRSINIAWHILGDCLSVLILVFVSKWFLNKWTCIDEGNHIYRYLQILYTWRCIAVIVLFQWIPYIMTCFYCCTFLQTHCQSDWFKLIILYILGINMLKNSNHSADQY